MRPALAPIAFLLLAPPAPREQPPASCDVTAYVIDQDPHGVNVRAAPNATAAVVGKLPNDSTVEGVHVHLTASSGSWVRIDRAIEQGGERERTFFAGAGWVYARLLGTDGVGWIAGGTPVRAEPSASARVLTRILAGGDGATVLGCRGTWVRVEHKGVQGWAERKTLCDNSLTTCS